MPVIDLEAAMKRATVEHDQAIAAANAAIRAADEQYQQRLTALRWAAENSRNGNESHIAKVEGQARPVQPVIMRPMRAAPTRDVTANVKAVLPSVPSTFDLDHVMEAMQRRGASAREDAVATVLKRLVIQGALFKASRGNAKKRATYSRVAISP